MKFFDLFCGVGGFRLGMERNGHECIGSCEIEKYARQTYRKNFRFEPEFSDVRSINLNDLQDFDILCAGFPCQAWSVSGERKGFQDERGDLFFQIVRIAREKQPTYLFLENVKGLLSHDKGSSFREMLNTLNEVGYDVEWQVIDSEYFLPQHRERLFIIGHFRGKCTRKIFPLGFDIENNFKPSKLKMVKNSIDDSYRIYDPDGIARTLRAGIGGMGKMTGVYAMLTPDRVEKRQNGRRFKEDGEPAFTLNTQDRHGIFDGFRARKLTPVECERIQGFPDNWTQGVSDSQRYAQMGNAVTVNVIEYISSHFEGVENVQSC